MCRFFHYPEKLFVLGIKNREAVGRMTLTRLLLPFGRLQKEGPRRTEANTKKQ